MKLSPSDLIQIREQSLTLNERIGTKCSLGEVQKNDASADFFIKQWCQIVAEGNWEQFKKRLAWDDLDLSTIHRAFSSICISNELPLPAWVETLNECLKTTASVVSETLEKEFPEKNSFLDSQEPYPFEEVFLPFIYVARQNLSTQAGSHYELLSKEAHASLERGLLKWLSRLCSPSMELEFSIFRASRQSTVACLSKKLTGDYPRKHYQDFIQSLLTGKLLSFFREYPVLARLMATGIDLWVDTTKEFLCHLAYDWAEIQNTFQVEAELGKVIAVQPFLSDRHHNGRSVIALTFVSGLKLVYKPKDLGIEQAYFSLLAWLNEHGVPLPFKVLKILNRSTYGWVEFVEALPCKDKEDARRYYQRSGMLLCLVHILGGTDLHYENIIACGEHPILIDIETLMHPRLHEEQKSETVKGAKFLANQQLQNSVFRTALLPRWEFGLENQVYDVSGLGEVSQQEIVFRATQWLNINTDAMMVWQDDIRIQPRADAPSIDGANLLLNDYHEEIVDGFQQMYWFLMKQQQAILAPDGPLTALTHQTIRFVFRPTRVYSFILKETLKPKFLRHGIERSIQLDILSREMLLSKKKPLLWPLLRAEQQALQQMDIPLFTTRSDSDALTVTPNKTIDKCFISPSFNHVISYLQHMNDDDLKQQIYFIQGALYSHIASDIYHSSLSENVGLNLHKVVCLTSNEMLKQAIVITNDLQKQVICSSDGSATWIAPQYILEVKRFQLQSMAHGLYEGVCGVSLFLAALNKITHRVGFRNLSLAALQSSRQELKGFTSDQIAKEISISGSAGNGSLIYVLVRVSQFIQEPAFLEDAKQAASLINSDLVIADNKFDIISGVAGVILGLLALHNTSADSEVLERAIACGNHLLNNRVVSNSGYRAWATVDGKLLTGFSHGTAGIVYALLRLYKASGESAFLEAAQEAIAYERSVFIPEEGNWPDFRQSASKKRPTCMCSWCHGAAGIGLARVATLDILDTPEIRQDIEVAINTTKQYGLSEIDHLCCGNLGRIEFLFTAGRKLSQPDLVEEAMKQAAQVVARAQQRGHFAYGSILDFHPGFFQGAAGIGYELLRLAYPDQLPSVLLWE